MLKAASVAQAFKKAGFTLFTGTPCSFLTSLLDAIDDDPELRYVPVTNEAEAIAVAAGSGLGGKPAVALFQSSGLSNAINPLTSLAMTAKLPLLVLTTWRGQPGTPDEPQHELSGRITAPLFEQMEIPYEVVPALKKDLDPLLKQITAHLNREKTPFGLLLPKGVLEASMRVQAQDPGTPTSLSQTLPAWDNPERWDQDDALSLLVRATAEDDVIIASTGFVSRALCAIEDRPNQFYVVGALGCASTLGLGVALACPEKRVFVLDGDGALLMHLGSLATLGAQKPKNLIHVLFDNGVNDSTGGQPSLSGSVDFATLAQAAGYPKVVRLPDLEELEIQIEQSGQQLTFLHLLTAPRTRYDLPRPPLTPIQVAERLRSWLSR